MTEKTMKDRGRESGSEMHGCGGVDDGGVGWERRKSGGREGGREERIRRKATKKRRKNTDVCIVFDFLCMVISTH